ncbi:hypothetical protein D9M70_346280 [compost metagenome]
MGRAPAQAVEEGQPGAAEILEVTRREPGLEQFRRDLGVEAVAPVAEHPVDLLATRLGDLVDGLAHPALPGLAGVHPGHLAAGREQRLGLGIADHLCEPQRRVVVRRRGQYSLVQAGLGIAFAQLAQQHLARPPDQRGIRRDRPLRVRPQVAGVEVEQPRRQVLPQPRRNAGALRLAGRQRSSQEARLDLVRLRQHQVGLELVVGGPGPLGARRAVRR